MGVVALTPRFGIHSAWSCSYKWGVFLFNGPEWYLITTVMVKLLTASGQALWEAGPGDGTVGFEVGFGADRVELIGG